MPVDEVFPTLTECLRLVGGELPPFGRCRGNIAKNADEERSVDATLFDVRFFPYATAGEERENVFAVAGERDVRSFVWI